jgi:hypothetical protein
VPDPINPISIVDGDTHINKYPGKKIYIGGNEYLPIGTVLMYNGSGIANPGSRNTPLGDESGDTIKMPGWYVCNGNASTPNLLNKFVRAEAASGNTGGSDNAIVVSHNHGGVTGGMNANNPHRHNINQVDSGSGTTGARYYMHYRGLEDNVVKKKNMEHAQSISSAGVSGTGTNKPAYYSLIFIIRMA